MAYIQDSTKTFTITLTAFLEGLGIITNIQVTNQTSGITYTWNLSTGAWTPKAPEAVEGDKISSIQASIINQGAVADYLWAQAVSTDVTSGTLYVSPSPISTGTWSIGLLSFTMPAKNVSITINAGHVV